MDQDAKNELRYLRGRARYDASDRNGAAAAFAQVDKHSRFYANAQYLLGAIAARDKRYKYAEQRFCTIADQGVDDRYSFYVDDRFFEVQDLARLALGRTAHEQRRSDDAFYYYFQVPQDSPRVQAALFESAFASYEGARSRHRSRLARSARGALSALAVRGRSGDPARLRRACALRLRACRQAVRRCSIGTLRRSRRRSIACSTTRCGAARCTRSSCRPKAVASRVRPERRTLLSLLQVDPRVLSPARRGARARRRDRARRAPFGCTIGDRRAATRAASDRAPPWPSPASSSRVPPSNATSNWALRWRARSVNSSM